MYLYPENLTARPMLVSCQAAYSSITRLSAGTREASAIGAALRADRLGEGGRT